ncbi:type IX secretion system outer membrane channel protein PorV [Bernardetia sp. ABR2-2B]|uniref:type IX secretion system outer membrane channel protein PorV n=1 Tax=Bernardetia sp. ABR2-2B TaxID=3127472 RepID=UPI0030CBCA43
MQIVKSSLSILLTLILSSFSNFCFAQVTANAQSRAIRTAVPILRFSPDARGSSMGNAGVALSPNVNATFWNPSKLSFLKNEWNFGASYSPVFHRVADNMWFGYFSAAKKLNEEQAIALSSRYFEKGKAGNITMPNSSQELDLGYDFTLDASFAQKVSEKLSLAATFRYIRSNQLFINSSNTYFNSVQNVGAMDVSLFYKTDFVINEKQVDWNVGVNISNMGQPFSYLGAKEYLPANLAIGTTLTHHLNQDNLFTFAFDVNKLLVPTPNSSNQIPQKNVVSSIFNSFSDAPNGFSEEMQELILALGAEYSYKNALKLRSGYYHENENKGNNRYLTFGLGVERKAIALNVSLLKAIVDSPNDGAFQVSLICAFDSKKENL